MVPPAVPPIAPDADRRTPPESLAEQLSTLVRELPGLFSDRVELLSLELQRAAIALAQIVALVVLIAILGMTVWLAMWGAVISALVAAGMAVGWALAGTLLVNLIAACWAGVCIRRLLPRVSLPATRRHLTSHHHKP